MATVPNISNGNNSGAANATNIILFYKAEVYFLRYISQTKQNVRRDYNIHGTSYYLNKYYYVGYKA